VTTILIRQIYSNGGPRCESGPLNGEGRTSSATRRSILYKEVFIAKSTAFSRTSEPLLLANCIQYPRPPSELP